jgi:hypothetical protein
MTEHYMIKLAAKILVNLIIIKKSALSIFIVAAAIALVVFMITITIIHPINLVPNVVFAQQNQTKQQPLPTDLQKFFDQKIIPSSILYVDVYYQSNQTIVLQGDALTSARESNKEFWKAIDLVEHDFGYKLDKVVVNGIGSEPNPDRFYVIMTK